ncbi:uncharacterized protein LOC133317928 [Gastrolobium bilobum]|uniref:uncharacterized protein LOC133317928 n=1 Tax=Gastrolobium bilobum TaxID=150636 RepID=UPI002AB1BF9A|nr:uncharacterized protein LOC133317928 [Gastrolobium bilobum]
MWSGRKTQTFNVSGTLPMSPISVVSSVCGRNLGKNQLGGVIFGCKNRTIKECQSKQLFGLPAQHFSYVKNIDPGLPVFLFNYSDRKLYGIYEASSKGQMYIDPYAWTSDCSERTQYPAQVQIRVRLHCQPLSEDQFGQVIGGNYYTNNHFWFELDHRQTSKLMSLLVCLAIAPGTPISRCTMKLRTVSPCPPSCKTQKKDEAFETLESETKHFTSSSRRTDFTEIKPLDRHTIVKEVNQDEKNLIYMKLKELALARENQELSLTDNVKDTDDENNMCYVEKGCLEVPADSEKNEESSSPPFEYQYIIDQLMQETEELMAFKKIQTQKNCYLEQKLMEAALEIQHLKDRCTMLESAFSPHLTHVETTVNQTSAEQHLDPKESLFLIEGYDGESWLLAMNLYCPSQNVIKYVIKPMSSVQSYASLIQLKGELYVSVAGNGCVWDDSVESYSSIPYKRTLCPSMNQKKGSLARVSLINKTFAAGGVNGVNCFSDIEMLDIDIGRWISTRSMLHKRFAVAAVNLNGVLYATGGYNETTYSKYALGGFDERTMVPSIEGFDACLGASMMGKLMNHLGGYVSVAFVKESINVIEEVKVDENIVDTILESTAVVYGNNDVDNNNNHSDTNN